MAGGSSNQIMVSEAPPSFLKRRIIRHHFSKFGTIVRLTVYNSSCVILFEKKEQAERALLQGAIWKDFPLKIEFAAHNDLFETDEAIINEELNWHAEEENLEKGRKPTKTKANTKIPDGPSKKSSRLENDDSEEGVKADDSKSVSMIPFQSRIAKTIMDKLEILQERDRLLRTKLVKVGRIDASDVIRGICPDMCPEKERLMREVKCIVDPYESLSNGKMDHSKAVKEYTRSSADQGEPLPHELRPEPVLTMTMAYLINNIISRIDDVSDSNYTSWYDFCWGRLRAIRKDIIQQQLCDINIVTILEQCARFHIICYDRLWGTSKSHFDDKINTETLVNCLQSLTHMYEDLHRKGVVCPNEAEFNAYMILLKLNNSGLLMSEFIRYSPGVKQSNEVKEGIKIHLAYNNNMFSTYFKLVKQTTYLNACLMQRFFHHIRIQALITIVKAYSVPNKVSNISVSFIMEMLKLDSVEECVSFCDSLGLTLSKDENYFQISRNDAFITENEYNIKTQSSLVIKKRIPVAQAVVGVNNPLPYQFEHSVHSSFNKDGILNSDAVDASDQELKMLYDIVARNVLMTKLKANPDLSRSQRSSTESDMKDCNVQSQVFHSINIDDSSCKINDDYEDLNVSSVGLNRSSDYENEVDNVDALNSDSDLSHHSTSSSMSSKSSVNTITKSLTIPSPPKLADIKPTPKLNPFNTKDLISVCNPPIGFCFSQSKGNASPFSAGATMSLFTSEQVQNFCFSKVSLPTNAKVEQDNRKIENVYVTKLRKKLSENLKRISARKYLRLWHKKVLRIKAIKATEAQIICNVSAENYLKIWGCSKPKHFIKVSDRLTERKKANLMVQLILHSDIVDKFDKNVTKIKKRLINILGETSIEYANQWGNVSQPSPVFWKMIFALPPPIKDGSTFPMKFRIWCNEALSNNDGHNISIMKSSNGVPIFSKVIVIEGPSDVEHCRNMTSLALVTASDWETSQELEKRMTDLLNLINHPIPVVILNLGSHINYANSPDKKHVTFFEQKMWENSKSMNEALFNLARNIYLDNLKVKPFCNLLEIYVDKLFDFFRQDRYFHDELDVLLICPTNIICFYNNLVDFIVLEISHCYKHNCYATACEFKTCIDDFTDYNIWPDDYCDPNFLQCLSQCRMKCKLRPFELECISTAKDLLAFFRCYCNDIGCPELVSTLLRLIKPPNLDSDIKLSDHFNTVDWLRIIELLVSKIVVSKLLTFKVVYREDKLNDFINSRFWLESGALNYSKR